jgi:hypothetical protein
MNLGRLPARAAALLLTIALAACSSPSPNLYTIATIPGPVASRPAPKVIVLRDISLARYLDRIQIVRSSENFRLGVEANDWWGEPLAQMLSRVLVQELNQRLPGSSVYAESGAVTTRPDATIELNIQRLDEDAGGSVVLLAQADVARTGKPGSRTQSISLKAPPAGTDVGSEVAAISVAVGQLADILATMLQAR